MSLLTLADSQNTNYTPKKWDGFIWKNEKPANWLPGYFLQRKKWIYNPWGREEIEAPNIATITEPESQRASLGDEVS